MIQYEPEQERPHNFLKLYLYIIIYNKIIYVHTHTNQAGFARDRPQKRIQSLKSKLNSIENVLNKNAERDK